MVKPINRNMLVPVSRENLNAKIVAQVKGLIYSNGIRTGDRLPSERDLAAKFEVSRMVVREALKSLEQSGLVETRTGATGGAFVTKKLHMPLFQVTHDLFNAGELTLSHFYEARKTIECSTVRLAAKQATPQEVEGLRAINKRLLDEKSEPERLGAHNLDFHVAIAEISGNPLMKIIVHSVMALLDAVYAGRWSQVRTRPYMKRMYKRHDAIIRAIEARDLGRCEELMTIDTEYTQRLTLTPTAEASGQGTMKPAGTLGGGEDEEERSRND
jgi:GntR family transcriptional regulator, transcriptional repressor for pyruvate dehydrogenase complex